MTEVPGDPGRKRFLLIAYGAMLLVVAGFVVTTLVQQHHEHDLTTDRFYCTLSGVGPFDRAPKTDRLCIDIERNG
ncbi:MAG TPA: hypothetical protein VIH37_12255 [Candidatus Limnocylindrales bacterium]